MSLYLRPFAIGALTVVPGFTKFLAGKGRGSTTSATYCYGVWLKHLVMLWESGMRRIPSTMAELGPGGSLGVGLAALLCGVDRYYALDVIQHANRDANLRVFEELIALFRQRVPRPHKGWPDYDAHLDKNLFPSHILTDAVLDAALTPLRIARIRKALTSADGRESQRPSITYCAPWADETVVQKDSVDVIISHAVLQSVVDLESTYAALHSWLKPGAFMSHQIDYSSFNTSSTWNGHWAYSEAAWKFIVGKRSFLINREPHSTHRRLMNSNAFTLTCELKHYDRGKGIARSQLAPRWSHLSDDDLSCAGAFVQARKAQSKGDACNARSGWRAIEETREAAEGYPPATPSVSN